MKLLPAGMYIQEYSYDTLCTKILISSGYIGFPTEAGKLNLTLDGQTIQRGDAINHVPGTYCSISGNAYNVTPELGKGIQVNSPVYYIYDEKPVIYYPLPLLGGAFFSRSAKVAMNCLLEGGFCIPGKYFSHTATSRLSQASRIATRTACYTGFQET